MEEARGSLEELECFERAVVESLEAKTLGKARSRVKKCNLDFQMAQLLAECTRVKEAIVKGEQVRSKVKDEESRIRRDGLLGFYAERKRMAEYHVKYPEATVKQDLLEVCKAKAAKVPAWSGEERHGKYLDLHRFHARYLNVVLKEKETRIGYVEYLGRLADFSGIDLRTKADKEYVLYLKELLEYLVSFQTRAQALVKVDMVRVEEQFQMNWEQGRVPGWERRMVPSGSSAEDLVNAWSGEELSKELLLRGGKSGGTPLQRAERLLEIDSWQKKGQEPTKKIWKKSMLFDSKEVSKWEVKVQSMVEMLSEIVDDTNQFVTRKQTMTLEELQQEEEEERLRDEGLDDDDDDLYEDEKEETIVIDNPLNLPLDFDGKPIPVWLYKLHGLGVEYNCEICGNYSYWGRRAFDRHFQDWRHAHGMRLLGIPNTMHFHDITKIAEARALYEKLQNSVSGTMFNHDENEEVEDENGNVYTKKTYLDLKRQGIL